MKNNQTLTDAYIGYNPDESVRKDSSSGGIFNAIASAFIDNKPILVTNYATVGASINNGENGLIVSMNGESVAEGLMQLSENQQLRNQLVENLKKEKTGNEEEINKYIQLIEENLN